MLFNDLSNTNVVAEFDHGEILTFSSISDLVCYMKDEKIDFVSTLQCNYWGTYVINTNVALCDLQYEI